MGRHVRVLAALLGLSLLGFACAQLLTPPDATGAVSVPVPLPTTTVSVPLPTVSVPLPGTTAPPAPPLPTVTSPAPVPAPPPAPTPTLSPPPASSPPTSRAEAPVARAPFETPANPQPTGSSARAEGTAGPPSEERRSQARITRVRARAIRAQGSKRRGVLVVFRLSAPARVVFLVDGPTPDCDVVATFAVRGREGVNRVRFFGEVERRPLPPGTYILRPRIRGSGPRGVPVTVRDGERPSAVPGPRGARCVERRAVTLGATAVLRDAAPEPAPGPEGPSEETRGAVKEQEAAPPDDEDEGSAAPGGGIDPPFTVAPLDELPAALGWAVLALGFAAALFIVGYVVRFLRHADHPNGR